MNAIAQHQKPAIHVAPTKAFQHICWDGCMFSNAIMLAPNIWREVLATLIKVRNANGWD